MAASDPGDAPEWPGITRVEQRAFRAFYAAATTYAAPTATTAVEVYDPDSDGYWQSVRASNTGNSPASSPAYWAACAVDEGSGEATLAVHAAKSFAADTAFKCAGDMIQPHGGIGFTWEHDAHLYFKRARALQSMLGSGNWHREQIATMILGEAA